MNFKENETERKLRGGYYTPPDLAAFIVRWVASAAPKTILEPSCGDGAFFRAISSTTGLKGARILGFEIDRNEACRARAAATTAGLDADIRASDFLGWAAEQLATGGPQYDCVIGNPPFVRYQYLPKGFQHTSEEIFQLLRCKFTKHTNAWVPFVLASVALLRPGGRLAMVVPAELIHVMHAQSLRTFLGNECSRLTVIDPEEIWFSDTLQGAVILLAEKRASSADAALGLGIYRVKSREFVDIPPEQVFLAPRPINGKTVAGKWTRALLDADALDLLDELEHHPSVSRFDGVASVDVGIVTGANKFFLVSDEVVEKFGLHRWAHPMFGRSEHCPGVIYDLEQHRANRKKGHPTNFIWFPADEILADERALAYITSGEQQALHTRYKTGIREPWYSVPSVYKTEVGMLKRAHDIPRLIINRAGAYTTDTAYRITAKGDYSAESLVASFINPLTALSAELEGRHYGGGVLELVPSEIERLLVPVLPNAHSGIEELDKSVRSLPTESLLLGYGARNLTQLGLTSAKVAVLFAAWQSLKHRRQRTSSQLDS